MAAKAWASRCSNARRLPKLVSVSCRAWNSISRLSRLASVTSRNTSTTPSASPPGRSSGEADRSISRGAPASGVDRSLECNWVLPCASARPTRSGAAWVPGSAARPSTSWCLRPQAADSDQPVSVWAAGFRYCTSPVASVVTTASLIECRVTCRRSFCCSSASSASCRAVMNRTRSSATARCPAVACISAICQGLGGRTPSSSP